MPSFYPAQRILMGPGPSDVSPRVLAALSRPTIGHLDPQFIALMDDIKRLLKASFRTQNALTLPVSAPGSAGMEAVFVNLLEPGDKVIVCQNGVFGGRMKENVERCGGEAVMLTCDWGKPVEPDQLRTVLRSNPDAVAVAFVHAETSTGVLSDAETLSEVAAEFGCLVIVDAVTSLGGVQLETDKWGLDAVYSGSQKCLSCVPGLSPVTFSARAVEKIRSRKRKVQSWFLDMNLIMDYWGGESGRSYHHTAPVNAMYALHESLEMLFEEGLEASWARHAFHHQALWSGLSALDLKPLVPREFRLPQLNTVCIPEHVDGELIRKQLLNEWGIEIGAGLGVLTSKVWRIGLMGAAAKQTNVIQLLSAIDILLAGNGVAVRTAQAYYADKNNNA